MALALAALTYILRFSVNDPVVDEWDLTHAVLNMTLWDWSFTRLNEHLFIPANAAFWLLHKVSGLDFRAGMIANLIAHALAVLILMNAAKRLRGRTSMADLILPAALLHWGHAYNLLMSYQLAFGLFILSAATVLWIIATAEPGKEGRTATRGAFALLLLMLNGGMGIAFVPPLAIWIGVLAWRAKRVLPFVLLLIAGLYTGVALFGASPVAATPGEPIPPGRLAWCVIQYLGIGAGLWFDGPHWPRNGIVIAAGYCVLCTMLAWRTLNTRDGGRSAGFLLFLVGHVAVAGGIAVSRGGGLAERYVTISAIGFVAAYLALLTLVEMPRWLGFGVAIALFAVNVGPGLRYGHDHRNLYRSFATDVKGGMPIGFLRDKYQTSLRVGANLEPALERLRNHNIREFAVAVPTPAMAELLQPDIASWYWPGPVLGMVVEIEVLKPHIWSEVRLRWDGRESMLYPPRTPGLYRLRLWVNDVPENWRLTATTDVIRIRNFAWLVPAVE